ALRSATLVPGVVAALLWWGVLPPIYDGIGVPALPIIASLLAILLATMAPLIADGGRLGRRPWAVALALTVVAAVAALAQPRFTRRSLQPLTFTFYQEAGAGSAIWVVRAPPPLPRAVVQTARSGLRGPGFPWSSRAAGTRSAPAPPLDAAAVPAPEVQVLESSVAG